MENYGLVSVIIPVFNVLPYLRESLDSVVNQTYRNLEIIIIDDGSTDGSGGVCDEYAAKDNRIRIIRQENKGLSAARNVGLDIMSGERVAFLDPDDKYMPNFIQLLLSELVNNKADIVICKNIIKNQTGIMTLYGNEKEYPIIAKGLYDRKSALCAYAEGFINHNVWNKIYESFLWKDIRFPVGHVYEDVATFFKVLDHCNRVLIIDDILYIRRIRSESITYNPSALSRQDFSWALTQFEAFIEENIPNIFNKEHIRRVRSKKIDQLISCYIRSSEREDQIDYKRLRKQILELKSNTTINSLRHRIAFGIILLCPWLLRLVRRIHDRIPCIKLFCSKETR